MTRKRLVTFGLSMVGTLGFAAAAVGQDVAPGPVAADDPMAVYYGATLHETRADGSENWMKFNPDHTFEMRNSKGMTGHGTFTFDPTTRLSCIAMPNRPAPPPGAPPRPAGPPCAPLPGTKVGDSWDRKGPTGMDEHYVIEAGR